MASKLGEALEIEAADSYIKRPAGPMITIELRDITKLAGYIRIPSMAEGAEMNDTVAQRIFYSGLPNQCRRCRRFGHHARVCNVIKIKPWEGASHPTPPPPLQAKKKTRGQAPERLSKNQTKLASEITPRALRTIQRPWGGDRHVRKHGTRQTVPQLPPKQTAWPSPTTKRQQGA
jgi:hypothetical protein